MKVKNVITTVGTTLINNLLGIDDFKKFFVTEEGKKEFIKSQDNIFDVISFLLKKKPDDKILGPEINSTYSLLTNNIIEPVNLYLIISDTISGRLEGKILERYFKNNKNNLVFENIDVFEIEGLQGNDLDKFKNKGLKNLVRTIGKIVRKCGFSVSQFDNPPVVINATGGYKAEIAFATVIGQSYGIPVYYQFEDFKNIIELPPQPISPDFGFWLGLYKVLEFLKSNTMDEKEYKLYYSKYNDEYKSKLDSLIESISDGGKTVYALSPIGELFFEVCEYKYPPITIEMRLKKADKKKYIDIKDPTARNIVGAQNFIDRVVREADFVFNIRSIEANPDCPVHTRFHYQQKEVILDYSDGKGYVRFIVKTTAQDEYEKQLAVYMLNKKFI